MLHIVLIMLLAITGMEQKQLCALHSRAPLSEAKKIGEITIVEECLYETESNLWNLDLIRAYEHFQHKICYS